jgi:hypothetical protein
MLFQSLTGFADENHELFLWNANNRNAASFCFGAQDIGCQRVKVESGVRPPASMS